MFARVTGVRLMAVVVTGVALVLTACSGATERPEPVPSATSPSDLELMLKCVVEAGFDASIYGDGLDSGSMPVAQFPVFQAVQAKCQEDLGAFPVVDPSELDWDAFYANTLSAADCLTGQGFEIPAAPSRPAFEQDYPSDPYSPFLSLPHLTSNQFAALEAVCPQPGF